MSASQLKDFRFSNFSLPRSFGVFGLMSCPGMRGEAPQGVSPLELLSRDVSEIRSNRVRMVISCLEPSELPTDPRHYRSLYKSERIQWELVPIPDFLPPSDRHDSLLSSLFETVDVRLQLGEKVGFHCRAGLGRTGTVVARYLIHKGMMPHEAIVYIRRHYSRKAIESAAQERYLYSFAAA